MEDQDMLTSSRNINDYEDDSLCSVLRRGNVWRYFLLQTLVSTFISFWPNFGIAWAVYKANLAHTGNATYGFWHSPDGSFPFGGDVMLTIALATFFTFLISCYFISLDKMNGPDWHMGVKIHDVPYTTIPILARVYRWIRPFTADEKSQIGCRTGLAMAVPRGIFQMLVWSVILGGPTAIISCSLFLNPETQFNGVQLACAKGFIGSFIALVQTPYFVWITLMAPPPGHEAAGGEYEPVA